MKKIKVTFLVIALATMAMCFVGCNDKSKNNNENEEANKEIIENTNVGLLEESGDEEIAQVIYESYEELRDAVAEEIKDYAGAINTINMYYNASGDVSKDEYAVSSLITDKKGTKNPLTTLGYALVDVTNDGVQEILIYDMDAEDEMKNVIVSMYTTKTDENNEKESYHILNSQTEGHYRLCENNIIEVTYSENPGIVSKCYYKINQDFKLEFVEILEYITNENGTTDVNHRVGESEEGITITSEEATNIENKYPIKEITVSPIIK
ncbi:MAG: hypothetical protein IJX99_09195 [Clostridia bacterium]|nr:hypothetical protein [Clostridia bacterium]